MPETVGGDDDSDNVNDKTTTANVECARFKRITPSAPWKSPRNVRPYSFHINLVVTSLKITVRACVLYMYFNNPPASMKNVLASAVDLLGNLILSQLLRYSVSLCVCSAHSGCYPLCLIAVLAVFI